MGLLQLLKVIYLLLKLWNFYFLCYLLIILKILSSLLSTLQQFRGCQTRV
jgi:hypothetical protein